MSKTCAVTYTLMVGSSFYLLAFASVAFSARLCRFRLIVLLRFDVLSATACARTWSRVLRSPLYGNDNSALFFPSRNDGQMVSPIETSLDSVWGLLQGLQKKNGYKRPTPPNTLIRCTLTTITLRNVVSERNCYLQSVLYCYKNMLTWLRATSTALHGAANLAVILDPLALLKKRSPIRAHPCHPAPLRCGEQEACQVNGLMCVGSLNRRVPKTNGESVCMELSPSLTACWVSRKQIKVAIMKFGSTFFHVNARLVDRVSREEKHR